MGKRYALNSRGVSAVSLATERGRALFERIRSHLTYRAGDYADFLPYQSYGRDYRPRPELRRTMLDSLGRVDAPLSEAVRLFYRSQGIKGRLKRYAKRALYYMPPGVTKFIKRFV